MLFSSTCAAAWPARRAQVLTLRAALLALRRVQPRTWTRAWRPPSRAPPPTSRRSAWTAPPRPERTARCCSVSLARVRDAQGPLPPQAPRAAPLAVPQFFFFSNSNSIAPACPTAWALAQGRRMDAATLWAGGHCTSRLAAVSALHFLHHLHFRRRLMLIKRPATHCTPPGLEAPLLHRQLLHAWPAGGFERRQPTRSPRRRP